MMSRAIVRSYQLPSLDHDPPAVALHVGAGGEALLERVHGVARLALFVPTDEGLGWCRGTRYGRGWYAYGVRTVARQLPRASAAPCLSRARHAGGRYAQYAGPGAHASTQTRAFISWSSSSTPKSTRSSVGPEAPWRPSASLISPTVSSANTPTQMSSAIGVVNARRSSTWLGLGLGVGPVVSGKGEKGWVCESTEGWGSG